MVLTATISLMASSGTLSMSSEITVRSAYLPGSIVPVFSFCERVARRRTRIEPDGFLATDPLAGAANVAVLVLARHHDVHVDERIDEIDRVIRALRRPHPAPLRRSSCASWKARSAVSLPEEARHARRPCPTGTTSARRPARRAFAHAPSDRGLHQAAVNDDEATALDRSSRRPPVHRHRGRDRSARIADRVNADPPAIPVGGGRPAR